MPAPPPPWLQMKQELFAQRGRISYQLRSLEKQLAEVDAHLEALDVTVELAAGLVPPPAPPADAPPSAAPLEPPPPQAVAVPAATPEPPP